MSQELTIKNKGLLKVIEERPLSELIKPLVNEIHLFDTFIAGASRVADLTVFDRLHSGDKLSLRREVSKFDDQAILVLNEAGEKLGYIPEKDEQIFARLMDAGKLLIARVTDLELKGSLVKVSIGIYLVDY